MQNFWALLREGAQALVTPPAGQLPALDGLRAIAILLVIATHAAFAFLGAGGVANRLTSFPLVKGGWVGVDLFFVLSGYLIGRQLWTEHEATGRMNVGRFVLKRGLRIWPLYLAMLLAGLLQRVAQSEAVGRLWPEALCVSNYFGGNLIPGSWSLSTEEQFYIIVPLGVALCAKWPLRRIRRVLFAALALEPVIRWLAWRHFGVLVDGLPDQSKVMTLLYEPIHTHCDGLLAGLLLASFRVDRHARLPAWLRHPAACLAAGAVGGLALRRLSPIVFDYTGVALLFGGLLWYCLQARPTNLLTRALSGRFFYTISKLSFGMYLMHQFVLVKLTKAVLIGRPDLGPAAQFATLLVLNLGVTVAAASLGYCLIEHPFLRLRARLGLARAH